MSILKTIILVFLAGVLAGCASSQKAIESTSLPSSSTGYVAGDTIAGTKFYSLALVLKNQATSADYIFAFSEASSVEVGQTDSSLIAIPPGSYRATHWIAYNAIYGVSYTSSKDKLSPGFLTQPFTVTAGEVTYLGKFYLEFGYAGGGLGTDYYKGVLKPRLISDQEAKSIVSSKHPNFSPLKLNCVFCRP